MATAAVNLKLNIHCGVLITSEAMTQRLMSGSLFCLHLNHTRMHDAYATMLRRNTHSYQLKETVIRMCKPRRSTDRLTNVNNTSVKKRREEKNCMMDIF